MHGCKSCSLESCPEKTDSFEIMVLGRGILWGPWATRKMDKWVREPVKPEYRHGRQGSLEDKSAGKGKAAGRGTNRRWAASVTRAVG